MYIFAHLSMYIHAQNASPYSCEWIITTWHGDLYSHDSAAKSQVLQELVKRAFLYVLISAFIGVYFNKFKYVDLVGFENKRKIE